METHWVGGRGAPCQFGVRRGVRARAWNIPGYTAKGKGPISGARDGGGQQGSGVSTYGVYPGTGTASAGESKRLRASVEAGGDHSVGKGALDRLAVAGTSMYAHPRQRQWHHASTEDVHRFREKENQRVLAGRQRDDAQQLAWDRQALLLVSQEMKWA